MQGLLILTTPELAPGYRLAGVETGALGDLPQAIAWLRETLDAPGEIGIVALHEPYLDALDDDLRRRAERSVDPLIVPLPPGATAAGPSERQARLLRMLSQAVGFQMTFEREEES